MLSLTTCFLMKLLCKSAFLKNVLSHATAIRCSSLIIVSESSAQRKWSLSHFFSDILAESRIDLTYECSRKASQWRHASSAHLSLVTWLSSNTHVVGRLPGVDCYVAMRRLWCNWLYRCCDIVLVCCISSQFLAFQPIRLLCVCFESSNTRLCALLLRLSLLVTFSWCHVCDVTFRPSSHKLLSRVSAFEL